MIPQGVVRSSNSPHSNSAYNPQSDQLSGSGPRRECPTCNAVWASGPVMLGTQYARHPDPTYCYGMLIDIKEAIDGKLA